MVSADVVFTVAEVAALLKVGRVKVYSLINEGELEHFRVGTVLRVRREALEAFMAKART